MNSLKLRLAVLVAGVGGLLLLSTLRAEDKKTPAQPTSESPKDVVKPKPLTDQVKKGLEYLVKQQNPNGGWGQGGGWRSGQNGGRIEGAEVKDPPDVGNTCIATLALIRSGNTAKDGPYAKNVAKAVEFICSHVDKSDEKSLYVTDIKGTQLHSKIGPYVDTFLTSMVLSELKGKMDTEKSEKMLMASLTKTISKIEKNQQADGTFAGNHGWASVLSQGLAAKGVSRAAQNGVKVNDEVLKNFQGQVAANFDGKTGAFKPAMAGGAGGFVGGGVDRLGRAPTGGAGAAGPSDAGVPLYAAGQGLTNIADVSAALKEAGIKAKKTLDDKDAKKEDKDKAQLTLKKIEENEKLREEATKSVVKQMQSEGFNRGFGSNGGEEFLSFMNIGEALLMKGGEDFKKWDKSMTDMIVRVQDGEGSWSGHHCITGKTFCTASALLVLMTDRAPVTTAADQKK